MSPVTCVTDVSGSDPYRAPSPQGEKGAFIIEKNDLEIPRPLGHTDNLSYTANSFFIRLILIMKIKSLLLVPVLCCALPVKATTLYPAQIVGRDANIPGLSWLGHVGITIANKPSESTNNIIEVLPEINAIQINSLADFKQRSQYWGSRYGIADQHPSAKRVIDEAYKQRVLCPIFTQSESYRVGLGTPDNPTRCAVFRSDTFVSHVFHTAGHDLPTYHGITLPLRVFYAFPKAHNNCTLTPNMPIDAFKKSIDLPKKQTTFSSIHTLWELAQNPYLNHEKRLFILDYLGLNGTPDLIEDFIQYYKKQTDADIKNMLIRSTFILYQTHFLNQPHPELQQFYKNLLDKPLTAENIPFVIRGFVTLSSTSQVLLSQYQINQQLKHHAKKLPPESYLSLNLLLAFKSSALEWYYMLQITGLLISENNADLNQQFTQALISRFKRLGNQALTPSSKQLIQAKLPSFNVIGVNRL